MADPKGVPFGWSPGPSSVTTSTRTLVLVASVHLSLMLKHLLSIPAYGLMQVWFGIVASTQARLVGGVRFWNGSPLDSMSAFFASHFYCSVGLFLQNISPTGPYREEVA